MVCQLVEPLWLSAGTASMQDLPHFVAGRQHCLGYPTVIPETCIVEASAHGWPAGLATLMLTWMSSCFLSESVRPCKVHIGLCTDGRHGMRRQS